MNHVPRAISSICPNVNENRKYESDRKERCEERIEEEEKTTAAATVPRIAKKCVVVCVRMVKERKKKKYSVSLELNINIYIHSELWC